MLDERTNWPQLYSVAVLLGAGFGLLLSLGALPSAPDWPGEWSVDRTSRIATIVLPVAGGALVGLVLAAAAHFGVRLQLRRRRSSRGADAR
jgi:Na+/H+ antiporter NhaA